MVATISCACVEAVNPFSQTEPKLAVNRGYRKPFVVYTGSGARTSAPILTFCEVTQSIRKVFTQADFIAVDEANGTDL